MFSYILLIASFLALGSAASLPVRSPQGGPDLPLINRVLRIQPLGDSITMGYQSTSGNGYRSLLYGLLTPLNTVTMVGSLTGGNMAHNHHEGHSGSFITQMSNFSMLSMDNRPNVILLHVGTNNFNTNNAVDSTLSDLSNTLDFLHAHAPSDVTILVAKLIPSKNGDTNSRINTYNSEIDGIVKAKAASGAYIAVVDMQGAEVDGDPAHDVSTADLADDLHPNDAGYDKMAWKLYHGLVEAYERGWITEDWARAQRS